MSNWRDLPGERKRFRARYYGDPPTIHVGDRHVFEPGEVIEEWSILSSLVRPDRVEQTKPRPGNVIRVIPPRPQDGRPFTDIWADDPGPIPVTPAAILTVLGPKVLCPPLELARLLDHLAHRRTTSDPERAAIANAVAPWLGDRYYDLRRAASKVPDLPDALSYVVWLNGVQAVVGDTVSVPVPPFLVKPTAALPIPEPAPQRLPPTTPNLTVRPDVAEHLRRHRAN